MPGAIRFGDEFLVNTITAGSQFSATITGLANGRFVATWVDDSMSAGDPSEGAVAPSSSMPMAARAAMSLWSIPR